MIQLLIDDQEVEIKQDEVIATDYSIAPISKVQTRTSSRSINFKLTKTNLNLGIISNTQKVNNISNIPYTLIKARLLVDGIDQNIAFCEIARINQFINIRLYGSNVNFYAQIKNKKISDLDLSAFDIDWTLAKVADSRNKITGTIYPVIDFHADSPNAIVNNTAKSINTNFMIPAFFVHTLIDKIISEAGYSLTGTFKDNVDYKSVIWQLISLSPSTAFLDLLLVDAQTEAPKDSDIISFSTQEMVLPELTKENFDPRNNLKLTVFNNTFSPGSLFATGTFNIWMYTAEVTGTYNFKTRASVIYNIGGISTSAGLAKVANGSTTAFNILAFPIGSVSTGAGFIAESTVDFGEIALNQGDRVFLFFQSGNVNQQSPLYQLTSATFEVYDLSADDYVPGDTIIIVSLFESFTQSDLLNLTVQMYGLMIDVNEQRKEVLLKQFSDIIDNIPLAIDVTDIVDPTKDSDLTFKATDYAQNNLCVYADDDTVKKPVETDSLIAIDNENLKFEKDLFSSDFAASEVVTRFIGSKVNNIKIWTDAGGADEDFADVTHRLLIIDKQSITDFKYTDGVSTLTTGTNIPLTRFIDNTKDFNLGWGWLLPRFSDEIIKMLDQYKSISELLRLDAAFINKLDFFIPLYLKEHNAYFYLSKINQHKSTDTSSTKVDLVKISSR